MENKHKQRNKYLQNAIPGLVSLLLTLSVAIIAGQKPETQLSEEAAVTGKKVAPISINYQLPAKAKIGEELAVTIKIKTESDVKDLKLKVTAPEGLDMIPQVVEDEYGDKPANVIVEEKVTIIPQKEGISYLNVFVTGVFGSSKMVRTGAVPVCVGEENFIQLKTAGQLKTTATGQKIISMPAQEN